MKKPIIMLTAVMMGASAALAAPVTPNEASKVAENFLSAQSGASASLKVKSVEAMGSQLYVVNFAPTGFAIVTSDDTSDPIVGYSTTGSISASNMPESMTYMMSEAAHNVDYAKAKIATPNRLWKSYSVSAPVMSRASGERIDPLIKVSWNQSSPYNVYCPKRGSQQALVGCVAVAMSQAMSVQQYPARPQGTQSYTCAGYGNLTIDFDGEKAYDWDAILSGANKNDEAARLLYHAGVAVRMNYGTEGSGIPSNEVYRIPNALEEFFGYSGLQYTWRDRYKGDWEDLVLNELYANRAVIYNAVDTKGGYGHSFNVDGYDGNGKFHVNWGWGGVGDGYFALDRLADAAMNMNYDSGHVIVTGIGANDSALKSLTLSDTYVEAGKPEGTFVGVLMVNDEPATSDMKVTVSGAYDPSSASYESVPFRYSNGQIVTTRAIDKSEGPITLRVEVKLGDNPTLRSLFSIDVEDKMPIESKSSLKYDRNTKTFTVHTRYGSNVKLKNAQGVEIQMVKDPVMAEYTFSRDLLTAGNNTLEITYEGETKVVNIKK